MWAQTNTGSSSAAAIAWKRIEAVLDPCRLLGGRELRCDEADDIAKEGGGQQPDLELVHVAAVDEDVGLARGDLLEAGGDGDGRVAVVARELRRPGSG